MAVLKQKIDGDWILLGPAYGGAPMCTYQVSTDALAVLHFEGVGKGTRVPPALLIQLLHDKLVWTGGTGPGENSEPGVFDENLFASLIDWSFQGKDEELPPVLQHHGVTLSLLFSKKFINWIATLDSEIPLSDFGHLPLWEFRSIASVAGASSLSSFHQIVLERLQYRLLWRLACLLGIAANGAQDSPTWIKRLRQLLEILKISSSSAPAQHQRLLCPTLRWFLDDQEIVAYLPRQKVGSGTKVHWKVGNSTWEEMRVDRTTDGRFVGDRKSEPLIPDALSVEIRFTSELRTATRKAEIGSTSPLLFKLDGDYLEEGSAPFGEYLLLHPRGTTANMPSGIEATQCNEPVGWWDWKAFRLRITKPCQFLGVQFGGDQLFNWDWELEPPSNSVDLADASSMFFGRFPVIRFQSCPSAGVLRISCLSSARIIELQVPKATSAIDLSSRTEVAPKEYGVYNVTGIPADRRGVARRLSFVYLPPARLSYIASVVHPENAYDLEVFTKDAQVSSADAGSLVNEIAANRWRIGSVNPFSDAVCSFVLTPPRSVPLVPVSVRLPADRLYVIGPSFGTTLKWLPLPVHLTLQDVDWRSRLRVQFAENLSGHAILTWRFSNRDSFTSGTPVPGWPNTYDISLSEWRDRFGPKANGLLQVLFPKRTVTVALFESRQSAGPATAISTTRETIAAFEELHQALVIRDFAGLAAALAQVVNFLQNAHDEELASPVLADAVFSALILNDSDSLARLLSFPRPTHMSSDFEALRLRAESRNAQYAPHWFNATRNLLFTLPPSFHTEMTKSELFYRFGRLPGSSLRALEDCVKQLFVAGPYAEGAEMDDLILLKSICLLLLGRPVLFEMEDGCATTHPAIASLAAVQKYLRTPIRKWVGDPIHIESSASWTSADILFMKAAAAQANALTRNTIQSADLQSARNLIDGLPLAIDFYWTDLLRARQFSLENRKQEAAEVYKSVLTKYDVVIDEMD